MEGPLIPKQVAARHSSQAMHPWEAWGWQVRRGRGPSTFKFMVMGVSGTTA
jgi:hypothetical protein